MEKDPFVYRIITEKGTVDFSPTYEGIMRKYKRYAADMERGYSQFVSVEWEEPSTKEYGVLFMKTRHEEDEPPICTKASPASRGIYAPSSRQRRVRHE